MNSRERVFAALDHKKPDRVPIDFWATDSMFNKIEAKLGLTKEQFLDKHDIDLRFIDGPAYIGPELAPETDIWGVERKAMEVEVNDGTEIYKEVTTPPLGEASTIEDLDAYSHWPSADWFDYSVIEAQCDAILEKDRVVVFMGDRLNRIAQLKAAMYVRGEENVFMDLALNAEFCTSLFDRIRAFYREYTKRILDAANGKIDIVLTGDDFGAQCGLMISPDSWRQFIQPGFAEFIQIAKGAGAKVMHHTCGSVAPIIPDMIESGLDVLQSLQPEAADMALSGLMKTYGDKLCFHGGVSIQITVPFGSPEDIRAEVQKLAELGRNGGYIFCTSHNIQADAPIANVEALVAAYTEFGSL